MVDDFMKGAAPPTASSSSWRESRRVIGRRGVLIATDIPREKKVQEYTSIFTLYGVDEAEGTRGT